MNKHTHLEDLSNEIFFEIFDIFTGFTLLNQRITLILQSIPLHIIVLEDYYRRRQINFLSSHLIYHAHQVISLVICDLIRDYSFIISLLFNLQSCIFIKINPLTKFENIIKQIQCLNKLVSFTIYQPWYKKLDQNDKNTLTRILLIRFFI